MKIRSHLRFLLLFVLIGFEWWTFPFGVFPIFSQNNLVVRHRNFMCKQLPEKAQALFDVCKHILLAKFVLPRPLHMYE